MLQGSLTNLAKRTRLKKKINDPKFPTFILKTKLLFPVICGNVFALKRGFIFTPLQFPRPYFLDKRESLEKQITKEEKNVGFFFYINFFEFL